MSISSSYDKLSLNRLTLLMLRLLWSNAQEHRFFLKSFIPCHVGIHLKALAEHYQMSSHLPGFQSFFGIILY